jgi:hypothetical protein
MKKLNPVYLWYSVVLLFPPLHELGHCMIAWLLGNTVYALQWNMTTTDSSIFQSMWEYSMLIPSVCVGVWAYFTIKKIRSSYVTMASRI